MTKKGRRRLFYSLVAIFFLVGAAVIFYAQGWRFTVSRIEPFGFAFKKIGAIYVRSYPSGADIYLDGKAIQSKNGVFASGTFINNLIPKNYLLELKAPGYQLWREHIAVQPALVSEAKYAVLVPQEPVLVPISANQIKNFWIINRTPLVEDGNGNLIANGVKLSGNAVIAWREDSRSVLARSTITGTYFLNDLNAGTSTAVTALIRSAGFPNLPTEKEILIDPSNPDALIFVKRASIEIREAKTGERMLAANSTSTILALAASRDSIAWATFDQKKNASFLNIYNRAAGVQQNDNPIVLGKTVKLAWVDSNRLGILQNDGELFIYKRSDADVSHIASDVRDFAWDTDNKMLAALENRSMEAFSLEDRRLYWRFNLQDITNVQSLAWYRDGRHLFITYPDRVAFLDLQDLAGENIATVAETSRAAYDSQDNKFYFLKNGGLFELEFAK